MFWENFEYDDKQEKKDFFVEDKEWQDSLWDDKNKNSEKEWEKNLSAPKTKAENVKGQINSRSRFLKNDEPQDMNPVQHGYTMKEALNEAARTELWGIIDPKIPWYKRTLRDGRNVEVKGWDDTFSITISKGNDTVHIDLSNFKKKKLTENNNINNPNGLDNNNEKHDNSMPKMKILGDIKLLDKNLKPEKPNRNVSSIDTWSQYDVAKVVESIDAIIWQERQDVHWNEQKRQNEEKETESKKREAYDLLLIETWKSFNENPPANEDVATYVQNSNNFTFDKEWQYMSARKTFLASCILLRSYNNMQSIIEKIIEQEKIDTHKNVTIKSIDSWENVAEYLSDNPLDLNFLIDNEEKIINLALNSNDISDEEKTFLQS